MNCRGQPDTLQANLPARDNIGMNEALRALSYLIVIAVGIGNAQAISAQEEEQESKKHHEIRYKMTIRTAPADEQKCEASIYNEFKQKDTVAVVDSTLSNSDCAASSGSYTVLVRFKDENNEMQSIEYPETWQRDDDRAIESHREYFIGDNVDLVTIRSRKLRCVCDSAGAEGDTPEE
jgi:hypothetical protein